VRTIQQSFTANNHPQYAQYRPRQSTFLFEFRQRQVPRFLRFQFGAKYRHRHQQFRPEVL